MTTTSIASAGPTKTRPHDPIIAGAVGLTVVAFAGSYTHVQEVVDAHGQHGWISWAIASMPEVSVLLSVLKVRRSRNTGEAVAWAWLVGVTSAAFSLSANLATAEHSWWGWIVAGWPAVASVGAAGMIHVGDSPDPTPAQETPETPTATLLPATAPTETPTTSRAPTVRVPVVAAVVTDRPNNDNHYERLLEAIRDGQLPPSRSQGLSAIGIQRHLSIGWPRANTLLDRLETEGRAS